MSLTKKDLIDAHEQGLVINTRNNTIKIVAIIGDIYGVTHFNSHIVKWWMFENFERNEAKIEQPKLKYNGRAVKCDNVEQLRYISGKCNSIYLHTIDNNFKEGFNYYELINDTYRHNLECIEKHIEIISFSQYCTENGITEPRWIQGFEIGKDYNDIVMVSQDNIEWKIDRLHYINTDDIYLFKCGNNNWKYCRYPRKEEINEIKFNN